jgi:membrane associated rhomboid family serine protease
MLDDRNYMRRPSLGSARSATVTLLIINVAAYLLQVLVPRISTFPFFGYCALSVEGLRHGYLWQLLTFQLLHANVWHLFFNCWAIFMFGREVEATLGRAHFWTLYFGSGVAGGLFQALAGLVAGGDFAAPVVGASAGAFGLTAAYAMLFPERMLTLLLFYIVPVNLKAKTLLLISGLLAAFGILFPFGHIAHAAHLGGIILGLLYVRFALKATMDLPHWLKFGSRKPVRKVQVPKPVLWAAVGNELPPEVPAEEFVSREVDPILDKISAQGIQSLTARERKILEAARARMPRK